jgi:hypothetical protein
VRIGTSDKRSAVTAGDWLRRSGKPGFRVSETSVKSRELGTSSSRPSAGGLAIRLRKASDPGESVRLAPFEPTGADTHLEAACLFLQLAFALPGDGWWPHGTRGSSSHCSRRPIRTSCRERIGTAFPPAGRRVFSLKRYKAPLVAVSSSSRTGARREAIQRSRARGLKSFRLKRRNPVSLI